LKSIFATDELGKTRTNTDKKKVQDDTNGIIRDDSERYLTMHHNITVENIHRQA
jgi:hypothetical protein